MTIHKARAAVPMHKQYYSIYRSAGPNFDKIEGRRHSTFIHPIDALAAILIFSSTIYFVPHIVMAIGGAILVLRHGVKLQRRDIILAIFIVASLANTLFHASERPFDNYLSNMGAPIVMLTVLVGRIIPPSAVRVLIFLVCAEVVIGLVEFLLGRTAITSTQAALVGQEIYSASELLYNKRVMGLSANSSAFAEKVMLMILMVFASDISKRWRNIALIILMVGLYVSFNRSAIITISLLFAALFSVWSMRSAKRVPLLILSATAVAAAAFYTIQPIVRQFYRGHSGFSYSELARVEYLRAAISDIMRNPFFGNGSFKWTVYDSVAGQYQHAHNSIVMLTVENGLLLASLLIVFVLMGWRRKNTIYIVCMLVYSFSQYLFFWNISLGDIFLHKFTDRGRALELFGSEPEARRSSALERGFDRGAR